MIPSDFINLVHIYTARDPETGHPTERIVAWSAGVEGRPELMHGAHIDAASEALTFLSAVELGPNLERRAPGHNDLGRLYEAAQHPLVASFLPGGPRLTGVRLVGSEAAVLLCHTLLAMQQLADVWEPATAKEQGLLGDPTAGEVYRMGSTAEQLVHIGALYLAAAYYAGVALAK